MKPPMLATSLDSILGTFDPATPGGGRGDLKGGPVTIWLSPEYKAKYDRIQEECHRQFTKTLRAIIQAAIDQVDSTGAAA